MKTQYLFALATGSIGLGMFIGWSACPKLEELDAAGIRVTTPKEEVTLDAGEHAEGPEHDEPQYPPGDYYERPWMPTR